MKNRKLFFSLIAFFCIVITGGSYYVYQYPYQKSLAKEAITDYMDKQGVSDNDIEKIEYRKDTTQGGWIANVTFKSDPEYQYEYIYGKVAGNKNNNYVLLLVYQDNVSVQSGFKYKKLE